MENENQDQGEGGKERLGIPGAEAKPSPELKAVLVEWRVNTPSMFQQIISNNQTAIFTRPLQITANLLAQVAARASELNDPTLNALMCRLALYDCADPYSEGYDEELTERTLALANGQDTNADAASGATE